MPKDKQQDSGDSTLAGFERALQELETLVEELESGELDLNMALQKFERGVALTRSCQKTLKAAELRVEQLLDNGDTQAGDDGDDAAPADDDPEQIPF